MAGIPVDLSRIQELCSKTDNTDAALKTNIGSGLHQTRFVAGRVKLTPYRRSLPSIGAGVGLWDFPQNPFTPSRMKRLASEIDEFFPRALLEPKLLVCVMDDWYPNSDEVTGLSVSKILGVWAAHGKVLNVHCRWENLIRHTREEADFEDRDTCATNTRERIVVTMGNQYWR